MRQTNNIQEIKQLLEKLKTFSDKNNKEGVTRLAYTAEDEQAHDFMTKKLSQAGLSVRKDAIGNIFARLPGKDSTLPAVGTGSHIDTVPQGGAYDGTVGVISGFYALTQFKPKELLRDLELIIFRAEESSRFGFSCAGSKVLCTHIDANSWSENTDSNGINIFQSMDECGYSSKEIDNCLLPDNYFSSFVELHIEQGKRLETNGLPIGIVNGIAAPTRFCITVEGAADHSGATPMNQRHDALVASAHIIEDINYAGCLESSWGTVSTVGKIEVSPNSMNVIPGKVIFYVDIRGIEVESIDRIIERLTISANKAEIDHGVSVMIRKISSEKPIKLDEDICDTIAQLCEEKGIHSMTMLSGAGHDSMNMAKKFPTAMIFVPSKEGISHHPNEYTSDSEIEVGANLLKDTLAVLANKS